MSWFDRFEQWIFWFVTGVATVAASSGAWLVKKVLTSEKIIQLHEAEFKNREQQRAEDRERMARLEAGQDMLLEALLGKKP